MKRIRRGLLGLLTVLLLLTALPVTASAAAPEPPCFTVLVYRAPKDVSMELRFTREVEEEYLFRTKELVRNDRLWESCFRFQFHGIPIAWKYGMPEGTELVVRQGDETYSLAIPKKTENNENTLYRLDLKTRELVNGEPPLRGTLLLLARMGATFLVLALLFHFAFRYRERKAWLIYLGFNIATQLFLNCYMLRGYCTLYSDYALWNLLMLCIAEFFIYVLEIIFYSFFFREYRERRATACAFLTNTFCVAVLIVSLYLLPM